MARRRNFSPKYDLNDTHRRNILRMHPLCRNNEKSYDKIFEYLRNNFSDEFFEDVDDIEDFLYENWPWRRKPYFNLDSSLRRRLTNSPGSD